MKYYYSCIALVALIFAFCTEGNDATWIVIVWGALIMSELKSKS